MKIALTTDHTGLELLQQLKTFLEDAGYECVNFGPEVLNPDDDYPQLIKPAAVAVANGDCDMGIIMGGSGQGEAIAANRIKGARCTVYYGPAHAVLPINAEGDMAQDDLEILRLSRVHNNANMLSLAARFLTIEDMQKAVSLWLTTAFSAEERHVRRIKQLDL